MWWDLQFHEVFCNQVLETNRHQRGLSAAGLLFYKPRQFVWASPVFRNRGRAAVRPPNNNACFHVKSVQTAHMSKWQHLPGMLLTPSRSPQCSVWLQTLPAVPAAAKVLSGCTCPHTPPHTSAAHTHSVGHISIALFTENADCIFCHCFTWAQSCNSIDLGPNPAHLKMSLHLTFD